MTPRSTSRSTSLDPAEQRRLAEIAPALASTIVPGQPQLVALVGSPDQGTVTPIDLPREDPVASLIGFVAPRDWWAVGLIADGPTHRLESPTGDSDRCPGREKSVRLAYLVSRTGAEAQHVLLDGAPMTTGSIGAGRAPDTLRRVLRRRTPRPTFDTGVLWATIWLDEIVAIACHQPDALREWSDVALLHPGTTALVRTDPRCESLRPVDVIELGRQLARRCTWAGLRRACTRGEWRSEVFAHHAHWMDAGMFSRAVLELLPHIEALVGTCEDLLQPDVVEPLRDVLSAWGLPVATAP